MKLKTRLLPFIQNTPRLLLLNLISSLILLLINQLLYSLSKVLLGLSGRVTISSGDFTFLFTSWQGWLLIILGLATVLLYIAIDVNAQFIYCGQLLSGEKPSLLSSFAQGFLSLKKYLDPRGPIVILYLTLLSPIIGLGFSVSLTRSFYIPKFINAVIENNLLYFTGMIVLTLALLTFAVIHCFILHGALLGGQSMKESGSASRKLLRRNWKNFIWEMIRYFLTTAVISVVGMLTLFVIPIFVAELLPMSENISLFITMWFSLLSALFVILTHLLFPSYLLMKTILLYKKYTAEREWAYTAKAPRGRFVIPVVSSVLVLALSVLSVLGVVYADDVFPAEIKPQIVAHRAGGKEAPENTAKGLEVSASLKAAGGEIDIQRTSDGKYVVNHDDTFQRVAGDPRKSYEMTLEQVKQLRVDGEPVSTLEEMLEASRDKLILFVELKGETADRQMADDAVRIIKEMDMADQTVIISLKYDVLAYVEEKYPEMETGYLAFFSFGDIENTPFDYLALEEEIATPGTIDAIHDKGKKIMVWTVNDEDDIESFLLSDADMIITDEVKMSLEMKERLQNRDTADRIIDMIVQ